MIISALLPCWRRPSTIAIPALSSSGARNPGRRDSLGYYATSTRIEATAIWWNCGPRLASSRERNEGQRRNASDSASSSPSSKDSGLKSRQLAAVDLLVQTFRNWRPEEYEPYTVLENELRDTTANGESQLVGADGNLFLSHLSTPVQRFVQLLRQGEVRTALVDAFNTGAFLDPEPWVLMPTPTFSAVMALLDPFTTSPVLDPAHGVPIFPPAFQNADLSSVALPSGVRIPHAVLFYVLRWLVALRIASNILPTSVDWKTLLRLAGSCSSPKITRRLWSAYALVRRHADGDRRNSSDYAELLRARFLSHPMFTQFHPAASRASIFDIGHKRGIRVAARTRGALASLRLARATNVYRADPDHPDHNADVLGLNSALVASTADWFNDYFGQMLERGVVASEDLVCTLIAGFARLGSMAMVRRLFASVWGIEIHQSPELDVSGGRDFVRGHPLEPTDRLIETAVLAFASNGDIPATFKVADHISSRYHVEIPHRLWTTLLQWTHISTSSYVRKEWQLAGFPTKVLVPNAVGMVWDIMVKPPYKIKPSLEDYDIYIKYLIRTGRLTEAATNMSKCKRMFWDPLKNRLHEAEGQYMIALVPGVRSDRRATEYERAVFRRELMFAKIISWVNHLCKAVNPIHDTDEFVVRILPDLLLEFEDFHPFPIKYHAFNGDISIRTKWATRHFLYTASRPRLSSKVQEALQYSLLPSNFRSKRWWRDIYSFAAANLGTEYPSAALGPSLQELGLRGGRIKPLRKGRAVYCLKKRNIDGKHWEWQTIKVSRKWRAIELHYTGKGRIRLHARSYVVRSAVQRVKAEAMRVASEAGREAGLDSFDHQLLQDMLVQSRHTSGVAGKTGLGDIMEKLTLRAQRTRTLQHTSSDALGYSTLPPSESSGPSAGVEASENPTTKWKSSHNLYVKALHPGISDDEPWKWSMTPWPDVRGARMARLAEARKAKVFLDGKELSQGQLAKLKQRAVEDARKREKTQAPGEGQPNGDDFFAWQAEMQKESEDSKSKRTAGGMDASF